jgi:uncharacterized protein (TIGR02117 family)
MQFGYFLINLFFLFPQEAKPNVIYIAKNDWHVGIIFKIDEHLISNIDAVSNFKYYDYVDIGWGDADFYQSSEDFDLFLASKAILFPTSSVIRVQGYTLPVVQIFKYRDYVFKLELNELQYQKLCEFIVKSFEVDSANAIIVTSKKYNGVVKFFSSIHKYHVFNTCNTWVGEALEFSGFEINSSKIITAEHLYDDLLSIGKVIKPIRD